MAPARKREPARAVARAMNASVSLRGCTCAVVAVSPSLCSHATRYARSHVCSHRRSDTHSHACSRVHSHARSPAPAILNASPALSI